MKKIALITGGNRGIGFETCKLFSENNIQVILSSRDIEQGKKAVEILTNSGLNIDFIPIDVTDIKTISNAKKEIIKKYKKLDILINNAGICIDYETSFFDLDSVTLEKTIEVNLIGTFNMCKAFIPLMEKYKYGRIVNVSSRLGSYHFMIKKSIAYSISKLGLNALTKLISEEVNKEHIKINAITPGWVNTRMGGKNAPISTREAASLIHKFATLNKESESGLFYGSSGIIPF